jgi:CelD/BcsL family acetyltransferase involved in cellulose biosynthesis
MPFCRIEDMRGPRVASLPFCDFCDPLVTTEAEWRQLSDALLQEGEPLFVRCLHNDVPLSDSRFRLSKQAMWHGLSLEPTLDTLWDNLDGAARRAVRKAEKEGVQSMIASDPADMRYFFDLHLSIRKYKYGLLAQPYSLFENIWRRLLDDHRGFLLLASYQGRVIGSVVYLIWQDTLIYKFSASSADSLELRATDLLIWEGMKYAKKKGLRYFDFGLSDLDQDGLIRFKCKFANEQKTINFLVANEPEIQGDLTRQASAMLQELTRLLTHESVPDLVTEKSGDLLYRYFA